MQTLLLDTETWSLVLDAAGNIAVASDPYSQAQDAASAQRTFLGECYFDTTLGIDYVGQIFNGTPTLAFIKAQLVAQALPVPGVASAMCYISALTDRVLQGQTQITNSSGQTSASNFSVINPQGNG